MLWMIFQGSNPMAASTTPTRIDNRTSRNATASGEPPRKRERPSLAAGNSRVSLGIDGLPRGLARTLVCARQMGNPPAGVHAAIRCLFDLTRFLYANRCPLRLKTLRLNCSVGFQHPLQRLQPVGLARRL